MSAAPRAVSLFAGAGGWDTGAEILGIAGVTGVDIDADACATARAAGHVRLLGDVRDHTPADGAVGLIVSPPCPTWSAAGRRSARGDLGRVLEAIDQLGVATRDTAWRAAYEQIADPRTALIIDAVRLALHTPDLEWVVAELTPAAEPVWQELAAELATDACAACHVLTVDAADVGAASRRRRTYLVATRHDYAVPDGLPARAWWTCGRWQPPAVRTPTAAPWPPTSMASALGWAPGQQVVTRGQRRTSGGNAFRADQPAWCLTEKARSWTPRLTPGEAGLLVGFPADYPWQGSRSRQFLQAADAVSPPVAAALLGIATGTPWQAPVRDYLDGLYPHRRETIRQLELLEVVA